MAQTPDNAREIIQAFREAGQGHVFRWWDDIGAEGRARLLEQVRSLDLRGLAALINDVKNERLTPEIPGEPEPVNYIPLPQTAEQKRERAAARKAGEKLIRADKVAVLTAAGGQASRLRFDGPKGTYPLGAVSGKSLFEIRAERVRAERRRYGSSFPWYVMTSHATDAATRGYFEQNNYFGLPREDVHFFQQATMPVLDMGFRLVMAAKDELLFSPDGNGGALLALREAGVLDDMAARGVEIISYVQVDNCLVPGADPVFVGFHRLNDAQMSNKAMAKRGPDEPVGAFVNIRGRPAVVEYSDLTDEQKRRRRADGALFYGLGSSAIHLFSSDFVRQITDRGFDLPIHLARKSAPVLDDKGEPGRPGEKNVYKFEHFIFDAMRLAERTVVLEFRREEEFSPVKQLTGPDSVEMCRGDMTSLYATWLEQAGTRVPRDPRGRPAHPIEISPLYALDARELAAKIPPHLNVDGPLYLGPD